MSFQAVRNEASIRMADIYLAGGGLVSVIASLTLSDWGLLLGLVAGALGICFKSREHRAFMREKALNEARILAQTEEIRQRTNLMLNATNHPASYFEPPKELKELEPTDD